MRLFCNQINFYIFKIVAPPNFNLAIIALSKIVYKNFLLPEIRPLPEPIKWLTLKFSLEKIFQL